MTTTDKQTLATQQLLDVFPTAQHFIQAYEKSTRSDRGAEYDAVQFSAINYDRALNDYGHKGYSAPTIRAIAETFGRDALALVTGKIIADTLKEINAPETQPIRCGTAAMGLPYHPEARQLTIVSFAMFFQRVRWGQVKLYGKSLESLMNAFFAAIPDLLVEEGTSRIAWSYNTDSSTVNAIHQAITFEEWRVLRGYTPANGWDDSWTPSEISAMLPYCEGYRDRYPYIHDRDNWCERNRREYRAKVYGEGIAKNETSQ